MQLPDTPTVSVQVAAAALGVSFSTFYAAVRAGEEPVPVIRCGKRIVVPTAPLKRALGISDGAS
jgi:predicted site-specific integrase-resolvase